MLIILAAEHDKRPGRGTCPYEQIKEDSREYVEDAMMISDQLADATDLTFYKYMNILYNTCIARSAITSVREVILYKIYQANIPLRNVVP